MTEIHEDRLHRSCHAAVRILANLCAVDTNKIIEKLTGYLWDEEEAGHIKNATEEGV